MAVQFEPVSVVKQAIKYGISVSRVIYELMPFGNWKLAGDECRPTAVAVFEDFEQIMTDIGVDGLEAPIIESR